ncbi:MAG: ribulose-phosphate 3-epimerase [Anaerolineae bacterium]|nr:ribulose-phosphate 3-epimerase [Anaerolineae bacterium]
MVTIEASILAADYARLGEQAREAEAAGVDGIQIDVMDGSFVPNITFGPGVVRALRREVDLFLDVDLMIVNPQKHLEAFVDAGANRLIVHREACSHPYEALESIRDLGVEVGVALAPETSLSTVEELLGLVDFVQIMTVAPGWGGQPFIHSQLDKIRRLSQMLSVRGLDVRIGVDGGINNATAPLVVEAGATVLVAGSAVYRGKASVVENVAALKASVTTNPEG